MNVAVDVLVDVPRHVYVTLGLAVDVGVIVGVAVDVDAGVVVAVAVNVDVVVDGGGMFVAT